MFLVPGSFVALLSDFEVRVPVAGGLFDYGYEWLAQLCEVFQPVGLSPVFGDDVQGLFEATDG